jgi:hypothetical protein
MDWFARGRACALAAGLLLAGVAAQADPARDPTPQVRQLLNWIAASDDAGGKPYAVVDKKQARIFVFDGNGRPRGTSVALIGSTAGDHSVPGVGARAQTGTVRGDERTTPAGRFEAMPGTNLSGEHVVWADYASAFAIHRVRPGRAYEARLSRLASATPQDNRVSLGCVVVPVAFYEEVVQPVLGRGRSVVYVLPETRSLEGLFTSM